MAVEMPHFREDVDAYPEWMQEAFSEPQLALPHVMKWQIAIRWHNGFTAAQKHVALTLSTYMDAQKMIANPSVTTLARNASRKPETVRDSLRTLSTWGWLSIKAYRTTKGNERAPNRYVAQFPEAVCPIKWGYRTVALTQAVPF